MFCKKFFFKIVNVQDVYLIQWSYAFIVMSLTIPLFLSPHKILLDQVKISGRKTKYKLSFNLSVQNDGFGNNFRVWVHGFDHGG